MALDVWDGFDHYNGYADLVSRLGFLQWGAVLPNTVIGFVTGRNGYGLAMRIQGGGIFASFADRNSNAFIGFGLLIGTGGGGRFRFYDSVTNDVQVSVYFNPLNFAVQIYRGAEVTLLYASPNNVWTDTVWSFIEIWPVIDDVTGSVQVRVNGVTVATVSGVDTQNTANQWWDVIQFAGTTGPGTGNIQPITIDDFYYGDTSIGPGAHPCNQPIGDCQVRTLFATGDDVAQWIPSPGPLNYEDIDEIAMDSDATYNYSSNPGDYDRFTFQPLQNTVTTVYGIQLTGAYRKDDAGMRVIKQTVVSNSVAQDGADHSVPDVAYAYFTDPFILNPDTLVNWTLSDINDVLAGYELVS